MAKRTNLRLAVAELGAAAPAFDAVTTFSRTGERFNPAARLVERGRVVPDPDQPRKRFDEEALEELADSLRQYGILQPLVVRPLDGDGKYAIVNGERRYRAALLADLPEIPVIVRDSPADRRVFEMLIENLQRADLTIEFVPALDPAVRTLTLMLASLALDRRTRHQGQSSGSFQQHLSVGSSRTHGMSSPRCSSPWLRHGQCPRGPLADGCGHRPHPAWHPA
jgi:hypothetical protein